MLHFSRCLHRATSVTFWVSPCSAGEPGTAVHRSTEKGGQGAGVSGRARKPLDWNTILSTFTMVFIAELGDKTQLSTMMLAAQTRSTWSVFLGASLALCATSFLGVLFGHSLYRLVAPETMRAIAGAGFILVGVLVLLGKF